jgi:hypothetical protein
MHLAKRIAAGAPDRNERRQLFPQRHQCQRARERRGRQWGQRLLLMAVATMLEASSQCRFDAAPAVGEAGWAARAREFFRFS